MGRATARKRKTSTPARYRNDGEGEDVSKHSKDASLASVKKMKKKTDISCRNGAKSSKKGAGGSEAKNGDKQATNNKPETDSSGGTDEEMRESDHAVRRYSIEELIADEDLFRLKERRPTEPIVRSKEDC